MTNDGSVSTYSYNGSGMRASKTVNGSTLKQIWDGTNIVAETDESGAVTAKYYRGISLISQERSGRVSYYQFNGHGDVTGLTDTSGNVTASYQYDAFGVEINPNQSDSNPFRYCGEYFDPETNNVYLRNRYYSPGNGRFLTEDPAKDGLNWYVYCANNPIMLIDPSGLFTEDSVLSYDPSHKNNDVIALQNELAYLGYLSASDIDGYFGQTTLNAVNRYKTDNGLWNDGQYEGKVGITTWQSLGLLYLTRNEVKQGFTIFTEATGRQLIDVTTPFNNLLRDAEQYLNSLGPFAVVMEWLKKVNHGGDWDIKVRDSWEKTFGGAYPGSHHDEAIYNGRYTTPEKLGNMLYGYTGLVVGWTEPALYAGSFYAAKPSNWAGVSAELDDWDSITEGMSLYYDTHWRKRL